MEAGMKDCRKEGKKKDTERYERVSTTSDVEGNAKSREEGIENRGKKETTRVRKKKTKQNQKNREQVRTEEELDVEERGSSTDNRGEKETTKIKNKRRM